MAAREFHLVMVNQWDSPLIWKEDKVEDGDWQDPWYPSKVPGAGHIDPSEEGEWRSESSGFFFGGILTGTSGWARWAVRVVDAAESGEHFEFIEVNWDLDYFNDGNPSGHAWASMSRTNPKGNQDAFALPPDSRPPLLEIIPALRDADGNARAIPDGHQPSISKDGAYVVFLPWSWFANNAFVNALEHPRVDWIVRRRGSIKEASTSPEPSRDATHGIIYFVDPIIEPTFHAVGGITPASGGNLKWARHVGREDGSFQWEGPQKVGVGWADSKQLFSDGNGIIYRVTPIVPASLATGIGQGMRGQPASGGDLMWYHHLGWDDGSFRWDGPKKVGIGWGDFKQLFSGGDGIIYGVTPIVPASLPTGIGPGMRGHAASGGDLLWYRHVGREDGSFQWEGPKKVGTGWGDFKQLFSGGDGIIYGVTPIVPTSLPTGIGPGMRGNPASGGDLLWYRHVGREDGSFQWEGPKKVGTGWGDFKHLFCGADGIIYAVANNDDLMWYRHDGRADGSFRWATNSGGKVGNGWNVTDVFSG
jgi:hypothetical protein